MKQQISTTPEQSQRLIACGVNPDCADMLLYNNALTVQVRGLGKIPNCATPAWSLSALLALLPNKILVNDVWYECQLCKCPFGYEVRYHSDVFEDPFGCLCNNPIEGCVEAIKWLTSNGYDLNKD